MDVCFPTTTQCTGALRDPVAVESRLPAKKSSCAGLLDSEVDSLHACMARYCPVAVAALLTGVPGHLQYCCSNFVERPTRTAVAEVELLPNGLQSSVFLLLNPFLNPLLTPTRVSYIVSSLWRLCMHSLLVLHFPRILNICHFEQRWEN